LSVVLQEKPSHPATNNSSPGVYGQNKFSLRLSTVMADKPFYPSDISLFGGIHQPQATRGFTDREQKLAHPAIVINKTTMRKNV
jgi:hypothetical protein